MLWWCLIFKNNVCTSSIPLLCLVFTLSYMGISNHNYPNYLITSIWRFGCEHNSYTHGRNCKIKIHHSTTIFYLYGLSFPFCFPYFFFQFFLWCCDILWLWLWLNCGVLGCCYKFQKQQKDGQFVVVALQHVNVINNRFIDRMVEVGQVNDQMLWKV